MVRTPRFGEAEALHLPFRDQIPHGARDLLDRHVRVDAVLVEQVDRLDPQPLERALRRPADVLRAAIQATGWLPALVVCEPELRRDGNLAAERGERFAEERLVRERPIRLRRVEERHAAFDGRADER